MNKTITDVVFTTNTPTSRGYIYDNDIFQAEIKKFDELIDNNTAFGELEHPSSSVVSLSNVSHKINKAWLEKTRIPRKKKKEMKKLGTYSEWVRKNPRKLMSTIEVFTKTPEGKMLSELISGGVGIGIGMRAVGNEDSLQIITFDAISKNIETK